MKALNFIWESFLIGGITMLGGTMVVVAAKKLHDADLLPWVLAMLFCCALGALIKGLWWAVFEWKPRHSPDGRRL